MHYTIAVRSRIPFIWRKYKVIQHWFEGSAPSDHGAPLTFPLRMCLKTKDRAVVVVPNIAMRWWRLYPDFEEFCKAIEEAKRQLEQERARLAEEN